MGNQKVFAPIESNRPVGEEGSLLTDRTEKDNVRKQECNKGYEAFLQGIVFVVIFFLLQGCNMKGQLIKDMDALYMSSTGKTSEERKNVSQVVQKYFPPGMKLTEALKYLDDQGFEIYEYTQDGHRKWPDGELRPYEDWVHKKSARMLERLVGYGAQKQYDCNVVRLMCKRAVISIDSDDGERIISSRGFIYIDGL